MASVPCAGDPMKTSRASIVSHRVARRLVVYRTLRLISVRDGPTGRLSLGGTEPLDASIEISLVAKLSATIAE